MHWCRARRIIEHRSNSDSRYLSLLLFLHTYPTWPIYNDEHVIHTVGPGCFGISGMNINIQKSDLMRWVTVDIMNLGCPLLTLLKPDLVAMFWSTLQACIVPECHCWLCDQPSRTWLHSRYPASWMVSSTASSFLPYCLMNPKIRCVLSESHWRNKFYIHLGELILTLLHNGSLISYCDLC